MYITLFILHMLGLSIGAGTSVYLAAVSRYAARSLDPAESRTLIPGVNGAISKVGSIGLALLILSGLTMTEMLGKSALGVAFWIKMALVTAIVVYVGAMQVLARRTRGGDPRAVATMKTLSPLGPLLALLTVTAAVVAFHS